MTLLTETVEKEAPNCAKCGATMPDLTQTETELSVEVAADARWRKNHAEWMGFYSRMTEVC